MFITAPAFLASALINHDLMGLDKLDYIILDKVESLLPNNAFIVSCSEESFVARIGETMFECLDYYYIIRD